MLVMLPAFSNKILKGFTIRVVKTLEYVVWGQTNPDIILQKQ